MHSQNVFFSPLTKCVVRREGDHSILSQLKEDFSGIERDIHREPVDEETMITLSVCATIPDWERFDHVQEWSQLAHIRPTIYPEP